MAEYIDREALLRMLPNDLPYKGSVKRVLMQATTADVVEVVRCKDCKHWVPEGYDMLLNKPFGSCTCEYWEKDRAEYFETTDNDYCSYGERREG